MFKAEASVSLIIFLCVCGMTISLKKKVWKLLVFRGPQWFDFSIELCGWMKLKFNYHTKEIHEKALFP